MSRDLSAFPDCPGCTSELEPEDPLDLAGGWLRCWRCLGFWRIDDEGRLDGPYRTRS